MPILHKHWIVISLLCSAGAHSAEPNYPTRPVRMLVGFTPGGTSDVAARIIGKKLTAKLPYDPLRDITPRK